MRRLFHLVPAAVAFMAVASCMTHRDASVSVDNVKRIMKGSADIHGGVAVKNAAGTSSVFTVSAAGLVASSSSAVRGLAILDAGTNTVTVGSAAYCTCSSTTASASYCSVSGTTLTLVGNVPTNYHCIQ